MKVLKRVTASIVIVAALLMSSMTAVAGTQFSDNWRYNPDTFTWSYYENGVKATNAWVHDHGYWYLLDDKGEMTVGIVKSFGRYYYMDVWEGTGHYGRLMKTEDFESWENIVTEPSGPYEGAITEASLANMRQDSYYSYYIDTAKDVSGTRHIEAE